MSQIVRLSATAGPSEFSQVLEQGISALKEEQKRGAIAGGTVTGGLVEIKDYDQLVVLSDLHGDSQALFQILDAVNYEKFLSGPENKMVFLGDYVDRGSDSIGVLYAICYLKHAHPDSVILMRGNHEAPSEFPFPSHDLPYDIEDRFGAGAKAIYGRILALFGLLTLATVVQGRLLLVHGGLPTDALGDWRQAIATAQKSHLKNRVMEELLWNDPRPLGEEWEPSWRGIGRHFGSAVTKRWLADTNTKVVVRGHEPCHGYRIDHHSMMLTLFSCRQAYPGFGAAYISAGKNDLDSVNDADDLAKFVKKLPQS
ncbi:putative phosphohydrolase [Candidatus Nitrososphaera evergladensis SR1]|uniref:Putative phosphohydrolase n=1 Tax=Candidatus Nitrososphaera evergladensis SR1 TaxID=1459636 RepID=A0A075MRL3_9ARCH|nr:metallophosphoesterase family protein [Candidatus Nitrososphaera evergladensis]AIF83457.1 putative phosphohydrolase [Candidatus Nitrososphaera evergladensis SR1]